MISVSEGDGVGPIRHCGSAKLPAQSTAPPPWCGSATQATGRARSRNRDESALHPDAFETACVRGALMTLDEALDFAIGELGSPALNQAYGRGLVMAGPIAMI